jgi:hypothetical protein
MQSRVTVSIFDRGSPENSKPEKAKTTRNGPVFFGMFIGGEKGSQILT